MLVADVSWAEVDDALELAAILVLDKASHVHRHLRCWLLLFRFHNLVRVHRANILRLVHRLLDRRERVLVDCMPTYVEDLVVGAHGVVAATVITWDLLSGKVLLRQ